MDHHLADTAMNFFLTTCAIVYGGSVLTMGVLSHLLLRNWRQSFHGKANVSVLTKWHPVYNGHFFFGRRPSMLPVGRDMLGIWFFTYTPILNLSVALTMLLGAGGTLLYRAFVAVAFGSQRNFERWKEYGEYDRSY